MQGATQKYDQLSSKKSLEKFVKNQKTTAEISRELSCNYQTVVYAFRKFGVNPFKKIAKYNDVEFGNWKTGKILKTKGAGNLKKKMGWNHIDWIHLYPVIRGERFVVGDYCLSEHLKEEYSIVCPENQVIKFKNWLKFAKERGLSETIFKKILDGEILYHNGFYLEKNKDIVPAKIERIATININGFVLEIKDLKEASNALGITKETLSNIIRGKTANSHCGAKLEKVEYIKI